MTRLPRPATPEGRAGLDALLARPGQALLATDFDGTLAPIVADPRAARPLPGAVPALRRLARAVGTVAVITGRPAAEAVACGGLDAVAGLIVLGHYGWQRWQDGELTGPDSPPAVQAARRELPGVLSRAGAADGTWVEDKVHALAVHTRRAADPGSALAALRGPLGDLAERLGLAAEPGRMVIELRPPGMDKGTALPRLARERAAAAVLFCGDDLGDLPAFAAVRVLRAAASPAVPWPAPAPSPRRSKPRPTWSCTGPDGIVALLAAIAGEVDGPPGGDHAGRG